MSDPLPSNPLCLGKNHYKEQILSSLTESFLSLKRVISEGEIYSKEYKFFRSMIEACLDYFEHEQTQEDC